MNAFSEALYQICLEEESTATVEGIRNLALSKIAGGEGKSLVSSSINGKSFSFNISKTADVLFQEASQAIVAYRGGRYTATQPDFSGV
jgi:hypothetical protein